MDKIFSARAIGMKATLTEIVEFSLAAGFDGIDLEMDLAAPLAASLGPQYCQQVLAPTSECPGSWLVPAAWRGDEDEYSRFVEALPGYVQLAAELGYTKAILSIWPCSNDRPPQDNLEWHQERLGKISETLAQAGQRLGVEYIATKTLRDGAEFEFIHDLEGLKPLIDPLDNVGVVLDSWHWHMAGESADTIRGLKPEDIIAVHVNDAPADIPNDEQVDTVRALPGTTGVIDLAGFMGALAEIGYQGQVTPEPFGACLRSMGKSRILMVIKDAMRDVWVKAGLEEAPPSEPVAATEEPAAEEKAKAV